MRVPCAKAETSEAGNIQYRDEVILKNASGYMLPGQTNFIMGASGAGKTTLLNALSGRLKIDKDYRLTGERILNDF